MRIQLPTICLMITILASAVLAGEPKPYTQWTLKEAKSILEKSPWSKECPWAQLAANDENLQDPTYSLKIRVQVQLYSSHPIRQALTVLASDGNPARLAELSKIPLKEYPDEIIITWIVNGDPKISPTLVDLMKQLRDKSVKELQLNTFLITSSGRKVFLKDYIPPTPNGVGLTFIFPRRTPDGQPLVSEKDNSLTFHTEPITLYTGTPRNQPVNSCTRLLQTKSGSQAAAEESRNPQNNELRVNATFKLKDMIFQGKVDF